MPTYMMLVYVDGETSALFYNDYPYQAAMDASCGLGAYVEIYERTYVPGEGRKYDLVEVF